MAAYSKFIAAVIGLVVTLGILDGETAQAVGAVLTAGAVLLFPNKAA